MRPESGSVELRLQTGSQRIGEMKLSGPQSLHVHASANALALCMLLAASVMRVLGHVCCTMTTYVLPAQGSLCQRDRAGSRLPKLSDLMGFWQTSTLQRMARSICTSPSTEGRSLEQS